MEYIKYIAIYVLTIGAIWFAGVQFADSVSSYEVIIPEPNIKCVVVSRMFNTSVDCWATE